MSQFVYDEKTLDVPTGPTGTARSLRSYVKAEATLKNGREELQPTLAPEHALLAVECAGEATRIFSPRGPLTLEELDLVDVIGNSLLLDGFLPSKPVAVGDCWYVPEKALTPFCCWDVVEKSNVQCRLKEADENLARFEISGRLLGAVDGVRSEMEIKARFRFDRRRGRIDWWGMLVRERRPVSFVMDGLDVVSQLEIKIAPQEDVPALAEADDLPVKSTPELLQLTQKLRGGGLEIVYDRQWHLYNDLPDVVILRRLEKGEMTVQCNVSSLADGNPEKLVSLEHFKEEVRKRLGESFGEFIEAAEQPNAAGRRVLRAVVRGSAKSEAAATKGTKTPLELPMRWIFYHLADARGRQAAAVFVLEEKYFGRLDGMDEKLVGSLRFLEPPRGGEERGMRDSDE
ncbi:MAG: hypothetical protein JXB10_15150 [Pirellulales bacterium]|nr:hypothetical protein [Pirellulales bacterium]